LSFLGHDGSSQQLRPTVNANVRRKKGQREQRTYCTMPSRATTSITKTCRSCRAHTTPPLPAQKVHVPRLPRPKHFPARQRQFLGHFVAEKGPESCVVSLDSRPKPPHGTGTVPLSCVRWSVKTDSFRSRLEWLLSSVVRARSRCPNAPQLNGPGRALRASGTRIDQMNQRGDTQCPASRCFF